MALRNKRISFNKVRVSEDPRILFSGLFSGCFARSLALMPGKSTPETVFSTKTLCLQDEKYICKRAKYTKSEASRQSKPA